MIRPLKKSDSNHINELLDITGGIDTLKQHLEVITKYKHLHLFGFKRMAVLLGWQQLQKSMVFLITENLLLS